MQFAFLLNNMRLCWHISVPGVWERYPRADDWGRMPPMRKATPFLGAVLAGFVLAVAAQAQAATKQTYKWVDEKGVVHYGDSVPSEYSQREQAVLNAQGVVVQK